MPPGAKKRKAAKKKQEQQQQEQQASSTTTTTQPNNLKSNNYDSRSQEESDVSKKAGFTEDGAIRIEKDSNLDTDERIEIIDSSHDHDKSSSSSSSGSNSSSSSDDESREVKKESEVITVIPDQPVPIAGDAPFMGATANVIVESTGLMDSADPKAEEQIEISRVETGLSNEADKISLPKPDETSAEVSLVTDETKQASSSATATDSNVKENKEKPSPLPKSSGVPEDIRESEVVISHEEEAPVRPEHGVAQRTSWLSCCGLFDAMSGSSR